ncbi:MAG: hypothetical protein ACR2LK_14105 [Solirubrobacteraceae bacterium]
MPTPAAACEVDSTQREGLARQGVSAISGEGELEVARAQVRRAQRRSSVLAPITSRAAGGLRGRFQAAGRTTAFDARIDSARRRARFSQKVSAAQARLGTGILTLAYGGDADTQPQTVRLRAASRKARLNAGRPRIAGARVRAAGTISKRARGVVRLQVLYEPPTGATRTLSFKARIKNGRFSFDERLPDDVLLGMAQRRGVVHSYVLYTGYLQARMRGEMQSYQILGNR